MAVTQTFRASEQSDLRSLYTSPLDGGPYTVHVDQWFTRRKRFHVVTRRDGEAVFRSRWMSDVIEWLAGADQEQYRIITNGGAWCARIVRGEDQKEA